MLVDSFIAHSWAGEVPGGGTFQLLDDPWGLALLLFAIGFLLLAADDLLVDFLAFWHKLGPKKLTEFQFRKMKTAPQKRLAIMVPAWKEANIIERMLAGNLSRLRYLNFDIFVGTYPNDPDTVEAVKRVSAKHPNVHCVVNSAAGPTSKGQILNKVISDIMHYEQKNDVKFDGFVLQDAEDIIHPEAMSLFNRELNDADFIQIPVFSVPVATLALVAGTYVDEFAENHTKDLLVRGHLGAAVPSAGVGTAISRRCLMHLYEVKSGAVFHEAALTEDYELGVQAHAMGFVGRVASYLYDNDGKEEFIATRECFPRHWGRSIRQKSRWTVGICLLGWRHLGWPGNFVNRFFLFRDRKALFSNLFNLSGYLFFFALLAKLYFNPVWFEQFWAKAPAWTPVLFAVSFGLMCYRAAQRARCVLHVYPPKLILVLPVRVFVGNFVNGLASAKAVQQRIAATLLNTNIRWQKTEHELPELFGVPDSAEA